ncbi:hypothetical protein HKX48_007720 [Thoreauomyces humboldtii]|nr:hypothetical protein HKX48_007720 [Thoreauomyces humboldtii]
MLSVHGNSVSKQEKERADSKQRQKQQPIFADELLLTTLDRILSLAFERAAFNPHTLVGYSFDTFWIWPIAPSTLHPLRALLDTTPRPFLLATRRANPSRQPRPTTTAAENTIEVKELPLHRVRCVNVGSEADTRRYPAWEDQMPSVRETSDPVTLDDARYLVSLYCALNASATLLPLYVLTEAPTTPDDEPESMRRTSYVGVQRTESGNITVHHYEDEGKWVSTGDDKGCIPVPLFEGVLSDARERLHVDAQASLTCNVRARYDVLAESLFKSQTDGPLSSIKLEAEWTGCRALMAPPPPSARITLKVRCVPGRLDPENHLPTAAVRAELDRLVEWDRIRMGGQWYPPPEGAKPMTPNMVDEWLKDIKDEGFVTPETPSAIAMGGNPTTTTTTTKSEDVTFDMDAAAALPCRTDLDFPERFWNFVRETTHTHDDLTTTLSILIEDLESHRLQPLVSKSNPTSLARSIRDLLTLGRTRTDPTWDDRREAMGRTFESWIREPEEMIVEVGIWKMRRDLGAWLGRNGVVSWDQIEHFVDPLLPLNDQVERLASLFDVLELWSLVTVNVPGIPDQGVRELVQAALQSHLDRIEGPSDSSSSSSPHQHEADHDPEEHRDEEGGEGRGQVGTRTGRERSDETVRTMTLVLPRFASETGRVLCGWLADGQVPPAAWTLHLTASGITTTNADKEDHRDVVVCHLDRDGLVGEGGGLVFGHEGEVDGGGGEVGEREEREMELLTDRLMAGRDKWRCVRGDRTKEDSR